MMKNCHTVKKVLSCVGFDPLSYKYYIDRNINGIRFRLYSYSKEKVLQYVYYKALSHGMPIGQSLKRQKTFDKCG